MSLRLQVEICTLFLLFPTIFSATATLGGQKSSNTIKAFVSISPQKEFVEKTGGKNVAVFVMVKPGHSPATYEPTPRQLREIARADIYFAIGVPFEKIWLKKIKSSFPQLRIIKTQEGINLRPIDGQHHGNNHHEGLMDPHIWLDPVLVQKQVDTIEKSLSKLRPSLAKEFSRNAAVYKKELGNLDRSIKKGLNEIKNRKLMVFHPSWGYFSDRYGLQQIAIESEGKEPTARDLNLLIKKAKRENIKIIFIQKQFSSALAKSAAHAIGGKVISIDPLAEKYIRNMQKITKTLLENLK